MTLDRIVIIFLVLSLGVTATYSLNERDRMDAAISDLQSNLKEIKATQIKSAQIVKTLNEKTSNVSTRLEEVTRYDAQAIASIIFDTQKDVLSDLVVRKIKADSAILKLLKGDRGEDADPKQIATYLLLDGALTSRVANAVWQDRREELTVDEKTIATVADAVYNKYKEDLKGPAGRSASAREIASELVLHEDFKPLLIEITSSEN